MSGVYAWYDADDTASITLNGSLVSQWDDKTGNAHHLSQASSSLQPAVTSSGLNGRDVITLTQDHLSAPSLLLTGRGHQAFVVVTLESSSNAWAHLVSFDAIGNPAVSHQGGHQWVPVRRNSSVTNIEAMCYHATTPTVSVVYGSAFIAASGFSSTVFPYTNELHVNGQLQSTGSSGAINATAGMRVGADVNNGLGMWDGLIAELIVSEHQIASEREKVEGYLAHKWGLTANLPSTHPYKSSAP